MHSMCRRAACGCGVTGNPLNLLLLATSEYLRFNICLRVCVNNLLPPISGNPDTS